jgi:hypothetical protein
LGDEFAVPDANFGAVKVHSHTCLHSRTG